ncbi:MAG: carboxypeptidase regulatory-like domain-containing protein [Saprospiraceae bacterium]|nr:carboxypeptidase regulatory-like domain-containing protein [Saprospiraceae bacterium]
MGLIQWLNSSQRKNWQMLIVNVVMGIVMGLMVIPTAKYFASNAPIKSYIFEGFVLDEENRPIPDATILIAGIATGKTSKDGGFRIKETRGLGTALQVGDELEIEVSAPGYVADKQRFALTDSRMQTLKFVLNKQSN